MDGGITRITDEDEIRGSVTPAEKGGILPGIVAVNRLIIRNRGNVIIVTK